MTVAFSQWNTNIQIHILILYFKSLSNFDLSQQVKNEIDLDTETLLYF